MRAPRRTRISATAHARQMAAEAEEARQRQPIDDDIDEAIRDGGMARRLRPVFPPGPTPAARPSDDTPPDAGATAAMVAANRLANLASTPEASNEYRLKLLHRCLLRQLPLDLTAQTMGMDVRGVMRLREELHAQFKREVAQKDIYSFVGNTDGFYNDVIGTMMQMMSDSTSPASKRMMAAQVALQAQRDRVHFFDLVGFYDVVKITPSTVGTLDDNQDKAQRLIEMSEQIMGVFNMGEDEPEETPRFVRNRREREAAAYREAHETAKVRVL